MRTILLLLLWGCQPTVPVSFPPTNADTVIDIVDTGGGDTGETEAVSTWPVDDVRAEPLSSVGTVIEVTWQQAAPASASWIAYTHEGADTWMETPVVPAAQGENTQVLLGIPDDREVTFEIYSVIEGETHASPEQYTAQTDDLPSDLRTPALRELAEDGLSDARYMLISVDVGSSWFQGPYYVLILNRGGEVVWYRKTSGSRGSMFSRIAKSGDHLLIDAATLYTFDESLDPTVTRLTLDGRHSVETVLPGMYYSWDELEDGSFLYSAASNNYEFQMMRRYPDGSLEEVWACYPWMAQFYPDMTWACAPNTVLYNERLGTVAWSMFETSTVVEIDLATGERVRHFGQIPGGWTVEPAEANFELQHYPNYTADGTLVLTTHVPTQPYVQAIREFAFDDAREALTQVWSYGEDNGRYASYAGVVYRLDNGNTLVGYGTDGVLQEVTPSGAVLWELEWRDRLIGNMALLDDLYALNAWDGE